MNTQNLEGRLIGIRINGSYYNCQTAGDLTLGASLTKNPICKPLPNGNSAIVWETSTVDSKNWQITFSGQSFLDSLTGYKNNNDLISFFVNSNLQVTVDFMTSAVLTDSEGYDNDFLFEGQGILSGLKLNAPAAGGSTYDVTIIGNGTPTFTLIVPTPPTYPTVHSIVFSNQFN